MIRVYKRWTRTLGPSVPTMEGKRIVTCYVVLLVALVLQELTHINAQVTFSKDWNAGKRSAPSDCTMSIKSAAAICQMLLTELKAVAGCEVRSLFYNRLPEEPPDSTADIFAGQHNG